MSRTVFWLLAAANLAVALGYGAILPLLPTMLGAFEGIGSSASVATHTGGLLGAYMLGLLIGAPLWGIASDRIGGRSVLMFGMVVYAGALVAFASAGSLVAAYGWRVLAGVSGGAVLPVVTATIGAVADRAARARLFAGASMATLLGLLAGPALSGLVYGAMQRMGDVSEMTPMVIGLPVGASSIFALLVAIGVLLKPIDAPASEVARADARWRALRIPWGKAGPALAASFLLLLGLGAFEAVLPVLSQRSLLLDPPTLGALLALCMVVMLVVQAGLFLAPVLHRAARGPFIAAGFLVVAGGIALLAEASSTSDAALAIGLIGAGGAFLQPAIAYLATQSGVGVSGTLLGALVGAGALGQALGSLAGGGLFALLGANSLWVVSAMVAVGAVWIGTSGLGPASEDNGPADEGRRARLRQTPSRATQGDD